MIKLAAAIAVLLILLVAAAELGGHGSGGLQAALGQKSLNSTALAQAVMQKMNTTPQLNVTYSGQVSFKSSGGAMGGLQLNMPLSMVYEKDGNNYRVNLSLSQIPVFGEIAAAEMRVNGTSYVCVGKMQSTLGSLSNNSSATGPSCQTLNSTGSMFNITNLTRDMNANFILLSTSQGSVAGAACTIAKWNFTTNPSGLSAMQDIQQINISKSTGSVSGCFSDDYYIPLSLNLTSTSSNSTIYITLQATAVNTNPSAQFTGELPGPVTASSPAQTGLSNGMYTTIPFNTTNTTVQYFNSTIAYQNYTTTYQNYTQSSMNGTSCANFTLMVYGTREWGTGSCSWGGGSLNVSVAGGDSGYELATITGANGKVYLNQTSDYRCATPYTTVQMPAQSYTLRLHTGAGGGYCGPALVDLSPP